MSMDESWGWDLTNLTGTGSRGRWPPGVGDNDLLTATFQARRYGGGPGLAVF